MENFFTRYRNASILVLVVLAQVVGLAMQKKGPSDVTGTRLLRLWVLSAITPLENAMVGTSQGIRNVWRNYVYLRGVRHENRELKAQLDHLRIEQVRLSEDAAQAHRLQALLAFKEQYVSQTVAAQVIGTSGSDQSRVVYIDKGANDGIKTDMAVITPDGIVGKVVRAYNTFSQVLLINDASSGVGAILEKTRLQGILQGSPAGETVLRYVMTEEKVEPGERILTSGGDRIFPKGLPIGTVIQATPGRDLFLNVRVKPSAELNRLEEVLVITRVVDTAPPVQQAAGSVRASDILAQRLPSVPPKADAKNGKTPAEASAAAGPAPAPPGAVAQGAPKPAASPPQAVAGPAATKPPSGAPAADRSAGTATTDRTATAAPKSPKPSSNAAKPSPDQSEGAATQTAGTTPAVVKSAARKTKPSADTDKTGSPDSAEPRPKPATPPATTEEAPR